ncbi:MAG: hypothetical protein H6737_13065 [Alphaproteobacteria bacterium]|nr:hypothetical protein [Alphaproteobacteria bacterium]
MLGTQGLRAVRTDDLKTLLALVHRGELECPITEIGLATTGTLRLLDDLAVLKGLDKRGVHAVLVSVLAERRR